MVLTKEERSILKSLVEKELHHIKEDGEKFFVSNSPVLGKIALDEPDLPVLKSLKLYKDFLERLKHKL